jgi:hypothetical protein
MERSGIATGEHEIKEPIFSFASATVAAANMVTT